MSSLTIEKAIEIQNKQLSDWEKILKPEVYDVLKNFIADQNEKAQSGNDILRGERIRRLIENTYLPHSTVMGVFM